MADDPRSKAPPPDAAPRADGESSLDLLARARAGDSEALDRLCRRHLQALRRWASCRLPRQARDLADTDDLVQDTLLRTIRNLGDFEPQHEGALQVYLRRALRNRIRDEIRRARRRPEPEKLDPRMADPLPSPLEESVGREACARYEAALERLRPQEREAIVLRIELTYPYERLAAALDKPSADAARMAVGRALVRLAEEMARGN